MDKIRVRELYKSEFIHSVDMVDIDDEVDTWYGMDALLITEEQIDELKNGKVIYFSDGEYAYTIALDLKESEK